MRGLFRDPPLRRAWGLLFCVDANGDYWTLLGSPEYVRGLNAPSESAPSPSVRSAISVSSLFQCNDSLYRLTYPLLIALEVFKLRGSSGSLGGLNPVVQQKHRRAAQLLRRDLRHKCRHVRRGAPGSALLAAILSRPVGVLGAEVSAPRDLVAAPPFVASLRLLMRATL